MTFSFQRENIAKKVDVLLFQSETMSSNFSWSNTGLHYNPVYTETLMTVNLIQVQMLMLFDRFFPHLLIRLSVAVITFSTPTLFSFLKIHTSSSPNFLLPHLQHQPHVWALLALIHFTELPWLSFQEAIQLCHSLSQKHLMASYCLRK